MRLSGRRSISRAMRSASECPGDRSRTARTRPSASEARSRCSTSTAATRRSTSKPVVRVESRSPKPLSTRRSPAGSPRSTLQTAHCIARLKVTRIQSEDLLIYANRGRRIRASGALRRRPIRTQRRSGGVRTASRAVREERPLVVERRHVRRILREKIVESFRCPRVSPKLCTSPRTDRGGGAPLRSEIEASARALSSHELAKLCEQRREPARRLPRPPSRRVHPPPPLESPRLPNASKEVDLGSCEVIQAPQERRECPGHVLPMPLPSRRRQRGSARRLTVGGLAVEQAFVKTLSAFALYPFLRSPDGKACAFVAKRRQRRLRRRAASHGHHRASSRSSSPVRVGPVRAQDPSRWRTDARVPRVSFRFRKRLDFSECLKAATHRKPPAHPDRARVRGFR